MNITVYICAVDKQGVVILLPDSKASPAHVVTQVSRLVSTSKQTSGLQNLLGDDDIDRFINAQIKSEISAAAAQRYNRIA